MRIVIDMQGAQTESHFRGIGPYTLSFSHAIARNRGEHEVILALNGLFSETIKPIRASFDSLLPQENIRVWHAPGPVMEEDPGNNSRREVAELIREAFLASLLPDVIHISSLFEGYVDNAVISIGRLDCNTPVSVSLYGLVPLLNPKQSLQTNPIYKHYFQRKVEYLKRGSVYLATSQIAAQEGISAFALSESMIVNLAPTTDLRLNHVAENLELEHVEDDVFVSVYSACDEDFWDQCAIRAIGTFMAITDCRKRSTFQSKASRRPRLAFVSPLPPERSGIADYSAELLPALAAYYDIEVVVAQNRVDDHWVNRHAKIRDVHWLRANAANIDRVLYHIGNSPFHQHMMRLMYEIPGVVVLHDFFIGHLKAWMEEATVPHFWTKSLYSAHGYGAVRYRYLNPDTAAFEYPVNFDIFQYAQGVIVHSEYARDLAWKWYGNGFADACTVIPLLRSPVELIDKAAVRKQLDIDDDDFVVCSFGMLGPIKLNHRLLECWCNSALTTNDRCRLIFVGEHHGGDYGVNLSQMIRSSGFGHRILITGYMSPQKYRRYLMAADVAVQLRTQSRGETSAAVLDCMNHALPLIVNASGSMAELDCDAVWMLPDEFDNAELVEALETLWREPELRRFLGKHAREIIHNHHAPAECAKRYVEAIEAFQKNTMTAIPAVIRSIAASKQFVPNTSELVYLSETLATTLPSLQPAKNLFLDVSATCRNDLKTGIQRVVRALVGELIQSPPQGYRVEPVYLTDKGGVKCHFRYARGWTSKVLDFSSDWSSDDPIEHSPGDLMIVVDFTGSYAIEGERSGIFKQLSDNGVGLHFLVYDLLPIQMPQVFPPGRFGYMEWLNAVCRVADGAICISRAVAEELRLWMKSSFHQRFPPINIGWFHLGADLENSMPTYGLPDDAKQKISKLGAVPSFLMVGTIEPRKGYLQVIEAFNQLWKEGVNINLIIVGKEGWKDLPDDMRRNIPETIKCFRNHPELNKRLFWLEGISDEYLAKVYASCTCLIAASYGEGFGLPLIEAAQHKLPIIARDIPVFREVAGEHAYYFTNNNDTSTVYTAIQNWLKLYEDGNHPKSDNMPWLTWKESAQRLCNLVVSPHISQTKKVVA